MVKTEKQENRSYKRDKAKQILVSEATDQSEEKMTSKLSSSARRRYLQFLLQFQWLLVLVFNYQISLFAAQETEEAVGYGYVIKSLGTDSAGRSMTAQLDLIKESSVFGPDIPNLLLTAR